MLLQKMQYFLQKMKYFSEYPEKRAIETLGDVMKKDPAYAWAWHCCIAMVSQDSGADWEQSQIRTSDFMHHLFGVKTWPRS